LRFAPVDHVQRPPSKIRRYDRVWWWKFGVARVEGACGLARERG